MSVQGRLGLIQMLDDNGVNDLRFSFDLFLKVNPHEYFFCWYFWEYQFNFSSLNVLLKLFTRNLMDSTRVILLTSTARCPCLPHYSLPN